MYRYAGITLAEEVNDKIKGKKVFTNFNSAFTVFAVPSEHRLVPVSSQTCS